MLQTIAWTCIAFVAGSLPFSVWVGRLLLDKDITQFGDENPGATNVMRAGGKWVGALALTLDVLKALLPVSIAYYGVGVQGWAIVPIALATIAGHAFSPFLHFHGGKAVATTLGVWMALTIWEGPAIGGLLLLLFSWLYGANGWAVLFMFVVMLPILLWIPPSWRLIGPAPEPGIVFAVWLGNLAIVAYKHRADYRLLPVLRVPRRKQIGA
jgi:glycerol-3-phosphate acyltransferase PlsY